MDEKTLTALKGSIAKWEGIVAGTMEDNGPDNCPLCKEFYHLNCKGCPVATDTAMSGCEGTPYYYYEEGDESEDIAKAELDYLRSLLPEGAP